MKYMRRTAGYTWTDYKTNAQIAKELRITPVLDKLLEYKRNWIQYVNRMPRNRLPKEWKTAVRLSEGNMGDLWRPFWIRETGTGQQVAQLHERYMIMMMMMIYISSTLFLLHPPFLLTLCFVYNFLSIYFIFLYDISGENKKTYVKVSYVYWTVHHCDSWRIKDQLDVTWYYISLLMCSTCFGH